MISAPGTVVLKAVVQAASMTLQEVTRAGGTYSPPGAWRTRLEPEDHAGVREMAEVAARLWYEETGQRGHAVAVFSATDHDAVVWDVRVRVGPEIVARTTWLGLDWNDAGVRP